MHQTPHWLSAEMAEQLRSSVEARLTLDAEYAQARPAAAPPYARGVLGGLPGRVCCLLCLLSQLFASAHAAACCEQRSKGGRLECESGGAAARSASAAGRRVCGALSRRWMDHAQVQGGRAWEMTSSARPRPRAQVQEDLKVLRHEVLRSGEAGVQLPVNLKRLIWNAQNMFHCQPHRRGPSGARRARGRRPPAAGRRPAARAAGAVGGARGRRRAPLACPGAGARALWWLRRRGAPPSARGARFASGRRLSLLGSATHATPPQSYRYNL